MKTLRWSGPMVDDLMARRYEPAAALPDCADAAEMVMLLGIGWGHWRRGRDAGVIPEPDRSEFWTRELADSIPAREVYHDLKHDLVAGVSARALCSWQAWAGEVAGSRATCRPSRPAWCLQTKGITTDDCSYCQYGGGATLR